MDGVLYLLELTQPNSSRHCSTISIGTKTSITYALFLFSPMVPFRMLSHSPIVHWHPSPRPPSSSQTTSPSLSGQLSRTWWLRLWERVPGYCCMRCHPSLEESCYPHANTTGAQEPTICTFGESSHSIGHVYHHILVLITLLLSSASRLLFLPLSSMPTCVACHGGQEGSSCSCHV